MEWLNLASLGPVSWNEFLYLPVNHADAYTLRWQQMAVKGVVRITVTLKSPTRRCVYCVDERLLNIRKNRFRGKLEPLKIVKRPLGCSLTDQLFSVRFHLECNYAKVF